jgi:cytochrome c oxidase assembly protein subunit 15
MISRSDTYSPAASADRIQPVVRFARLTLVYNVAVIVWGAYVRATGSGAGCGNYWPLCNGGILPKAPQLQTVIEFLHRVTSALALVMVASLLVWCWHKTSKGDWPRYSAVVAIILLFNEALLGALLVVFNHVGQDRSAGHAVLLCLHFGNTLLLLAALALTARWLSSDDRRFTVAAKPRELLAIGIGLLAVMSVGITGSLAALGDAIFPATSLRSALIQDFSSSSHHLLRLRLLHPLTVGLGAIYVLWIVVKSSGRQARSSSTLPFLVSTLILQVGLGVMNVHLLAPVWLQIVHLLVADLLWIWLVLASADLLFETKSCQSLLKRNSASHFEQNLHVSEIPSILRLLP